MPTVNVNEGVSVTTAYTVASKPKWLKWSSSNTLSGNAKLPSGHRRLVLVNNSSDYQKVDYFVNPINLSSSNAPWRMVIYAPNGSYIKSTGTGDIPTIGTPTVRIGVNAPSKAVVKFPVMKGSPQNILASTFTGWSDGHAEAVGRGMEITVEFRNPTLKSLNMVFRGMIYQIESGDVVTVTAYDRLMDLAQYSDQYQSHAGYTQNDTSKSRAVSGDNYVYQMNNNIGALLTVGTVDKISINATSAMTHGTQTYYRPPKYIIHKLPSVNWDGHSYSPQQGRKITQVSISAYSEGKAHTDSTSAFYVSGLLKVKLYRYVNNEFIEQGSTPASTCLAIGTKVGGGDIYASAETTLTWDVDWTIDGDPSSYYIGVEVTQQATTTGAPATIISYATYAQFSSSRLTVSGNYYTSDDGSSWTTVGSGNLPEVAVVFNHINYTAISTGNVNISGSTVSIAQINVPAGPSDTYMSTIEKGIQMVISYFISGAAGIRGIIYDLLEWAGLVPDVVNENMGITTYYTSSTYDYLTCIQELLRSGNYAIKAGIDVPGKAYVRHRHNVNEFPIVTFSTDPADYGTYEENILSHDLTAHWAAEKATQAYIAEDATISGLPIALETDDALMDNSLVETLQSSLRSIISDNSLGTHDLMANAAGGKMQQLHTNVFEGSMVLEGYRTDIWDFSGGYIGGQPIGIRVPEYGAQGTAIPTEIILGDGVTKVSLDNIRTADRNEVANSMGLSADAISNNAQAVPSTVYIFVRMDAGTTIPTPTSVDYVVLYDEDGAIYTLYSGPYIKITEDSAGYAHVVAVFDSSNMPSGYATSKPINRVALRCDNDWWRLATFDNPKYAFDGQHVHVDIRFERS